MSTLVQTAPSLETAAQVKFYVQIHFHGTPLYGCFAVVLFFSSEPRHAITPAAVKVMHEAATLIATLCVT